MTHPVLARSGWFAVAATLLAAPVMPQGASDLERKVEAVLADELAKQREIYSLPGAVAAVALPAGDIVAVAVGYDDVEAKRAMTVETRLHTGSIGKTFVDAVALTLEHEGVLGLDDKVSRYFGGEDWFPRLPNKQNMTLRHLLTHSSGLTDHVYDPRFREAFRGRDAQEFDPDASLSPRELLEFVLDKDPLFPAGEDYHYTDTGYILAGMVIEKASGRRFYDLAQKHVLEPLGLTRTVPATQRELPGLSSAYVAEEEAFMGLTKVVNDGVMVFNPVTEWTGGGFITNPQDLARWAKLLYEGEALPFKYLIPLLHSGYRGQDAEHFYGLGVFISDDDAGLRWGHGGQFPGFNCQMYYFPAYRMAVAMQTNTSSSLNRSAIMLALALRTQAVLDEAGLGRSKLRRKPASASSAP